MMTNIIQNPSCHVQQVFESYVRSWLADSEPPMTILEWIPVMVYTVPLIIWLVLVALMKNFHCCQRIQQRQSYKLRVHGVNPQSPLKV
jgi:hypothetical protein